MKPRLLIVLLVAALVFPVNAAANSDHFSDSTEDVPQSAFPLTGISFGHSGRKIVHWVFVGKSFRGRQLDSVSGRYGLELAFSTDGEPFYDGYRIGVTRDPGWFENTNLIGEVFHPRFTGQRVPVYKSGSTLRVPFRVGIIGSPSGYYFGALSSGPGDETECPNDFLSGNCWDEVAYDLEFFHDL